MLLTKTRRKLRLTNQAGFVSRTGQTQSYANRVPLETLLNYMHSGFIAGEDLIRNNVMVLPSLPVLCHERTQPLMPYRPSFRQAHFSAMGLGKLICKGRVLLC